MDVSNDSCKTQRWWQILCWRFHPVDASLSWQPLWWNKLCPFPYFPTYRQFAVKIASLITILTIWCVVYVVFGEPAAPGGQLFQMLGLIMAAYFGGWLWVRLTTLPGLIGMLLVGLLFRNLNWVSFQGDYLKANADLRKVALVIILLRAGLGLDSKILKKKFAAVLQLGLVPWACECILIACTSHYLLHLPWSWGFLLGSMIASVSPAVVVPCLFRLREEGYGEAKGIPTLVLAAAGIDDSVSVAVYGIIFSSMFSNSSATYNIVKGPLSVLVGIGGGVAWGCMTGYIPEKGDKDVVVFRFLLLLAGGLFATFLSSHVGWGGAGPLAVVSSSFVAAIFWEKQGWPINHHPVATIFRILWIFFEPILFAFTGAQIKFSELDMDTVKYGALCLVGCLVARMLCTLVASAGCGLDLKEKLFIAVTWLAKATVQAALGPVALDAVVGGASAGGSKAQEQHYGVVLLTVSVLSVILSAPLGAILIAITGPRLLVKGDEAKKPTSQDNELEEQTNV